MTLFIRIDNVMHLIPVFSDKYFGLSLLFYKEQTYQSRVLDSL